MSRRIYVAGGSSERALVSGYMAQLRAGGFEITHDWTQDPGYDGSPIPDSAKLDYRGVIAADYFWQVLPREKSEGAFCELGMAIAIRDFYSRGPHTVIVSGFDAARDANRIFCNLATRRYEQHGEALGWLLVQP